MTNDPTPDATPEPPGPVDPFEAELAASMRAAADPVSGHGVDRAGVDAAIARRRGVQRRRLGVAAAAVLLIGGGAVVVAMGEDDPTAVASRGSTSTTAAATETTAPAASAPCPVDGVDIPGLVRLTEFQIQVLIAAEQVDPATVFAARRGPVPVTDSATEALLDGEVGLDVDQRAALSAEVDGIEYLRDDQGVYTGYACPDGSDHTVATTTPATTTSTAPVTTTSLATATTGDVPAPTTTTTAAAPPTTTAPPAPTGPVSSADLAEGQAAWAVYLDAISLVGPPIDGHTRAGEAEDRWFAAQAVLGDAGFAPELVPVPCDGAAATRRVVAVLPDGPADADPDDVYVMGTYFLDEASARAAADRLGAEVLDVGPITATCVDAPGPRSYQR